ncbi:MAG: perosamine synthetase [Bacteroidetes bacterium HGW-Bacteroidetes-11]|jgi:perosamine synthetase|nr:MAG: perosamine synthetase [Bacteroidetes bacterium HGW-Bacteroidetes-11]
MYKYPVYQPSLKGNERKYVNDCIDTNWLTWQGKYVKEFETEFASYIGIGYASATCNATVALHLAMVALGIGPDDEVIVPTLTYVASVNSIVYCGAKPVFVDSLPDTWQMDTKDVERKITPKTKAIMAVHVYGHPCEMDELQSIAKKHNLFLIEDAAEAFGSKYKGKFTGTFGDISIFSFFGNKTITTGEGGMIVTDNTTIMDRVKLYKGQGLAQYREYWHEVVGYNYRMTNVAAAIGLAQLERADELIEKKILLAKWYDELLEDLPVTSHNPVGDVVHTYWMYSILAQNADQRVLLRAKLKENGIETRPIFHPVHTMPMYTGNYHPFKVAEDLGWRGINLPSYPDLSRENVEEICSVIRSFYKPNS